MTSTPLALDDSEPTDLMHLATAVPIEHRDGFLQAVPAALGDMSTLGPGIVHRTAAALQKSYVNAPPLRNVGKYR